MHTYYVYWYFPELLSLPHFRILVVIIVILQYCLLYFFWREKNPAFLIYPFIIRSDVSVSLSSLPRCEPPFIAPQKMLCSNNLYPANENEYKYLYLSIGLFISSPIFFIILNYVRFKAFLKASNSSYARNPAIFYTYASKYHNIINKIISIQLLIYEIK